MQTFAYQNTHFLLHKEQKMGMWALIFSLFYFFPMLLKWDGVNSLDAAMQCSVYLLFILLYMAALFSQGIKLTAILLIMMLICGAGTMLTYGTHSLLGYVGFFCGLSYRAFHGVIMMGVLMVATLLAGYFFASGQLFYFCLPAFIIGWGLFALGTIARREQLHLRRHQQDQQQIEQLAAIAERERIARDLHDLLGHSLSSIALKAELASKLHQVAQPEHAIKESLEVAELARSLLSEVRQAVSGLNQIGLEAQINSLQQSLLQAGFMVEIENDKPILSAQQESALCYMAKEAVTNILRHSRAKLVTISLLQNGRDITFKVKDNGKVDELEYGNGLNGIKDRALQLGAKLKIEIERGVRIQLTMEQSV